MNTCADDNVFDEIGRSFETLRHQCPGHYASVGVALGRWPVRLQIDGRAVWFHGHAAADGPTVVIDGTPSTRDTDVVDVRTTRACIRRVASGTTTLPDELLAEPSELHVRGPIDGVVSTLDSVVTYVDGALRCPDLEAMLDRFVGSAQREHAAH